MGVLPVGPNDPIVQIRQQPTGPPVHAVLPEGGVTALERKLAQIRHGETPLSLQPSLGAILNLREIS